MKNRSKARDFRKAIVLGMASLASVTGTGCASMKMPFSKSPLAEPPKFASTVTETGSGITGQFKSMGSAVSSAMGKAKTAVTSTFTSSPDSSDPTSLANMPTNLGPEIWVANGHYHESTANPAKALDNYSKALEIEPTNMSALLSTARLYAKQEQHAQAADFFNKAIAVTPDAATYNELALCYQEMSKPLEAQAAIQKAIEVDPANARYRNNLASMLVATGRSDEAVRQLEQVFPPAVANYNVAYLHFTNSNIAGAQQHLQLALQADPNLQPARELMDRLGGGQAAQAAVNTYNMAGEIYRTAQAVTAPSQTSPQATGFPAYPQPQNTQPQNTQPQNTQPQNTQPGLQPYPSGYSSQPAGGFSGMPTTGY